MRRLLALLLIIALLLLPGCGDRTADYHRYTLNPDGTLDGLRWGMTYARAVRRVKELRRTAPDAWWGYAPPGSEAEVKLPDGTVLGFWSGNIHMVFRRFSGEGKNAPLRLAEIRVIFYDAETEALCRAAGEQLTGMQSKRQTFLASPETLGDRMDREAVAKAWEGYTEEFIEGKCAAPLYTAAVTTVEYGHRQLTTEGYHLALAEILG